MILLPLGHEQETVQRLPWVTFGLMAVCFLVFLLTTVGSSVEQEIEDDVYAAIDYFLQHPHLELDPELKRMVVGANEELGAVQIELLREMVKPDGEMTRAEEQARLDELTERAFDSLARHPYRRFGLVPRRAGVAGFVTHMFMHGGWMHLLGNMFFLYLAGPFIEDVWGRALFLGFYVVSGFAAAIAHMTMFLESDVPMIGASGAIAGVMGAFLVRYATTKIQFFYLVGLWVRGTFWAPAWLMLPLWFVQQLFMAGMTSTGADGGGVGYWAHVGGFAFGAVAALAIRGMDLEERVLQPALAAKSASTVLSNPALEAAHRARAGGSPREAWSILCDALEKNPDDRDATLALWDLAQQFGWQPQACGATLRLVRAEIRDGEIDLALQHWFEVATAVPTVGLDAAVLLRIAEECHERGFNDWVADAVRRFLRVPPARTSAAQSLRAAQVVAESDRALAGSVLEAALSRGDLHPDEREQLAAMLSDVRQSPVGP